MQAERTKASTKSTGKSRPSSEDSTERPDFDSGTGTSSKPTHRSKKKRGQRRNKRRHEDSPDLEVPLTIVEEVSGDADEPPEKKSREKETTDDDDEDDDLVTPKAPADEAVTDPIVASEEEPRDSGVVPESSHVDLPEDSDDFEPSVDATFDDVLDELMEVESIPSVVEEGCEATGEVPPSSSGLEQGVPTVEPEVGATSSFGAVEMKPHDEISSPASSIGQSLLTIPPMKQDGSSQQMEQGETSSRPSLQYAKRVLKSDILAKSEEVVLDIASVMAFVDEVIALGNKWTETKSFPNGDFFNGMFVRPSS
ncbi:hypothetical protein AAC387_Pa12g0380 [Persea americana]